MDDPHRQSRRAQPDPGFDPHASSLSSASATRSITSPRARSRWSSARSAIRCSDGPIAEALGLPRDTARELAAERLRQRLEIASPARNRRRPWRATGQAESKRFRERVVGSLEELGPGLVTGAADDDPSGIATYSQAGAQFGYGLMWTMVLCYPLMSAVQLVSAHIGRVTGTGLANNLASTFPKRFVGLLIAILLIANIINIGADLSAMAEAAQLVDRRRRACCS